MIENTTKIIPPSNTFKNTFCVFTEVSRTEIQGKEPDYCSDSGSVYFYTEKGLYRLSNHWGRLGNCKWRLIDKGLNEHPKIKLGFALWNDFYEDNPWDFLYYLEVDFTTKTVLYQHKNNPRYDGRAVLRTSADTMKRVRQAKNIIELTNWSKHFSVVDLEELRKQIVTDLIYTNLTLEEIKRNYL